MNKFKVKIFVQDAFPCFHIIQYDLKNKSFCPGRIPFNSVAISYSNKNFPVNKNINNINKNFSNNNKNISKNGKNGKNKNLKNNNNRNINNGKFPYYIEIKFLIIINFKFPYYIKFNIKFKFPYYIEIKFLIIINFKFPYYIVINIKINNVIGVRQLPLPITA